MNARPRVWAAAALLTLAAPLAARAQDLAPVATLDAPPATVAVISPATAPATAPAASEAPAAGPTLASASVALRAPAADRAPLVVRSEATESAPVNALPAAGPSRNQSKALMIVGGAALIAGAIIGDTPGTLIMVAGAGVGLYGLYQYLQ